ncbi:MAG: hypothetical protein ACXWKG_09105 [Limisphaerales bacterium]
MKISTNRVSELTCRWGKPYTWLVKPKIITSLPANVEPMSQADAHQLRKAHHSAALRAVLAAAA